jgi:hypothetical protein
MSHASIDHLDLFDPILVKKLKEKAILIQSNIDDDTNVFFDIIWIISSIYDFYNKLENDIQNG